MQAHFKRVADSALFQNFVTGVILFAGVLVGIETYPHLAEAWSGPLHALDRLILAIFALEIVVKMGAQGSRPWRFFKDGWNCFDFAIVAAAFLPFNAQYVTVLRLLRLLRVLRLVRAVPKLQILVGALLKSLPSMGYVTLLLGLLFYIYAVACTFIFGTNDPVHFGSLQASLLSLFRIVTLEGWTHLLYIQMYGCANWGYEGTSFAAQCVQSTPQPGVAAAVFVSYILLGTMVMLNLFIGVIMNGMNEAQKEADESGAPEQTPLVQELIELETQLGLLSARVARLKAFSTAPAPERESAPEKLAG